MDIKELIDTIRPVSDEALEMFLPKLTPRSVRAKELITLNDGEEHTRWFALDGDIVASMFSFANGQPAIASVQALTDAEVYVMSIADAKELMDSSPEWSRWANRFFADGLYMLERRYLYIGVGDAMTRYKNLQSMRSFEMLQKVPLQYIASYLNMRPQTLSNIRKQLFKK